MEGGGGIDNNGTMSFLFSGVRFGWRVAIFWRFVSGLDNCHYHYHTTDILHGSV
jgi:hypothetical protein